MSIRFERFVKRMGKKAEFLPLKNRLLNAMKEDANAKYKNYPKLVESMNQEWEKGEYKKESAISHLLRDHEEFIQDYMKILFPFRNAALKIEDVVTPSRLDYVVTVNYTYSIKELKLIQEIIDSNEWPKDPTIEKLGKFLLLYCINSFAMPIQEVFKRPFAFFPSNVNTKMNEDGTYWVSMRVQGREQ